MGDRKPPAPRRGKSRRPSRTRWKPQHRRAALLRAVGKKWPEVADALGFRVETVQHYASLPGWDDLVAEQVVGEGRRILDEAFIPVVREMISLALRQPERKGQDDESVVEPKDAVKAAEWLADVWKRLGPLREREPEDEPPPGGAPSGVLGSVTVSGSILAKVAGKTPAARSRQRGDEDGGAAG